jgi:hypothetical protein
MTVIFYIFLVVVFILLLPVIIAAVKAIFLACFTFFAWSITKTVALFFRLTNALCWLLILVFSITNQWQEMGITALGLAFSCFFALLHILVTKRVLPPVL